MNILFLRLRVFHITCGGAKDKPPAFRSRLNAGAYFFLKLLCSALKDILYLNIPLKADGSSVGIHDLLHGNVAVFRRLKGIQHINAHCLESVYQL